MNATYTPVTGPMYWRAIIPQCDLSFFFLLKSEDALISNP